MVARTIDALAMAVAHLDEKSGGAASENGIVLLSLLFNRIRAAPSRSSYSLI
jgi:hypothetical protein